MLVGWLDERASHVRNGTGFQLSIVYARLLRPVHATKYRYM